MSGSSSPFPTWLVVVLVLMVFGGGLLLCLLVAGFMMYNRQREAGSAAEIEARAHEERVAQERLEELVREAETRRTAEQVRSLEALGEVRRELAARRERTGEYPLRLAELEGRTEAPVDAWGGEILYLVTDGGADFELWSLGRDRTRGGEGPDADLIATARSEPRVFEP